MEMISFIFPGSLHSSPYGRCCISVFCTDTLTYFFDTCSLSNTHPFITLWFSGEGVSFFTENFVLKLFVTEEQWY